MVLTALERKVLADVSVEHEWRLLETFARLVRVSGSEDERKAADYLVQQLRRWGVPVRVYEPELYLSIPRHAAFEVLSPEAYRPQHDDVAMNPKTSSFSASGEFEGDLVYVRAKRGRTMTELFEAEFEERVDAAGKAVLVDGLLLPRIALLAQELGAKAVVAINPGRWTHEGIVTTVWGTPTPADIPRIPKIIGVSISQEDGERVKQLLQRGRVEVRVRAETETKWAPCPLPVAEIRNPRSRSDEFILLHGHYDSWHVGIGDNAVGNATLLEVARVLHRHRNELERAVRVAWWPGHSTGRYGGSTWFTDTFALELDEGCVAQINCDSPGCKDATEFRDVMWTPEAEAFGKQVIRDVTGKGAESARPVRAGDYSFHGIGITSLFMLSSTMPEALRKERGYYPVGGCGGNIEWHTEHDDMRVADRALLERDTRVYLLTVFRLARAPVLPYDFRATVAAALRTLRQYKAQADGHVDLAPVLADARQLQQALNRLYPAIVRARSATQRRGINRCLRRLARTLIPVDYTLAGRFKHDPALEVPSFPDLAPANSVAAVREDKLRYEAVRTALLRGSNRVRHAFRSAAQEVASCLA